MPGSLDVQWIHGSADCATNDDPPLQVHAFDKDTYILRQNKCLNFEAPFLYLLFGTEKALLLDTGADPGPDRELPLRSVVQRIIDQWLDERRRPGIDLVVAHTHSHGDHVFGDEQFFDQPRTTVVPLTLREVHDFFGLTSELDRRAVFDLGERPLTVVAIPGHEPTHIALYDPKTQILFSGDTLYPGFLYVRDWACYRRSIARLVQLAADHPVRYVLGAHIEMTSERGVPFPSGVTYHPGEHVLQLLPRHLEELHATLERLGDLPERTVTDDFIIEPTGSSALSRFDTPGSLRDAPAGSPFYDAWHCRIDAMIGDGRMGSGGKGEFYNPTRKEVDIAAERSLVWMGFPRRVVFDHRDDRREAFRMADLRTEEDREKQEEYLEWRAIRQDGKITKVTFTIETPEYWESLFEQEPNTVVELYRRLVGDPSIVSEDLTSGGAYNKHNIWNTTKGIVHLNVISPLENSLKAAVDLAVGSATQLDPHPQDNYELQEKMESKQPTSADPRVTMDGNTLVRQGLSVTLREPVGLYIAGWDDTGWTRPDGSPVGNYWRIVRGRPGAALRVEYEVPKEEGFVVGDIRIGGRPIEFGGQIAEHVTVMIGGVAGMPRP